MTYNTMTVEYFFRTNLRVHL